MRSVSQDMYQMACLGPTAQTILLLPRDCRRRRWFLIPAFAFASRICGLFFGDSSGSFHILLGVKTCTGASGCQEHLWSYDNDEMTKGVQKSELFESKQTSFQTEAVKQERFEGRQWRKTRKSRSETVLFRRNGQHDEGQPGNPRFATCFNRS